MTNRKRNINRVRRRQRVKVTRPSATNTSEKYTEEGANLWLVVPLGLYL